MRSSPSRVRIPMVLVHVPVLVLCVLALLGIPTLRCLTLERGSGAQAGAQNGDVNGDGSRDISDAIYLLLWLFADGDEPVPCSSECPGPVHPVNDLAGYLDPTSRVLHVMPGHELPVLDALQARPAVGGRYEIDAVTVDGHIEPLTFHVQPAELPALFVVPQEDITDKSDYKVYKNARCETLSTAFTTECSPYGRLDGPVRYARIEYKDTSKCLEGSNYCVEVKAVASIYHIYDDRECTIETAVEVRSHDYVCKP